MKKIIKNPITYLIAIIGLLVGGMWAFLNILLHFEIAPFILMVVSFLEIIGFIFMKNDN